MTGLRARSSRQIALELGGHFGLRADFFRFDLADMHEHGAEAALYRFAGLAGLQRKGGIGDRAVEDRGLRHDAEIDVGVLQSALGGELLEGHVLWTSVLRPRALPLHSETRSAAPRAAPA